MSQRLIVTNICKNNKEYIASALYEENNLLDIYCEQKNAQSILGNIYVGRVKDVVKNINAAFIEIAPGIVCYYSLAECKNPIFVKKINSPELVQGDVLLVQVVKESMKSKPPRVTTNLNFTGKYLVLTTGNKKLGISKKLNSDKQKHYKKILEPVKRNRFGIVVRTNSSEASDEQIMCELEQLQHRAESIIKKAPFLLCFTCLFEQKPEYLSHLQNIYMKELERIITDDRELYLQMQNFLSEFQTEDLHKLQLYEDNQLSLSKLYSLEVKLEQALMERIWLKSGAYLVIQPTEALTVIDVNSGKSIAKKKVQEHYLKINLEAAKEAAHQLRLRNISGIIIIDFIDMAFSDDKKQLMNALRQLTKGDPVPVQVVDMTKLNLVELTRKKVRKSLLEQFT